MLLSTARDGTVKLWPAPHQSKATLLAVFARKIFCSALEKEFCLLGGEGGLVEMWDYVAGRQIRSFESHQDNVYGVAWSGTGTPLSAGFDGSVIAWTPVQPTCLVRRRAPFWCLATDATRRVLAAGSDDGSIFLWWLDDLKRRAVIPSQGSSVRSLAFSPDEKRLAVGCWDGRIFVWEMQNRVAPVLLDGHVGAVLCLLWSGEGGLLISGGQDKAIRIWRPPACKPEGNFWGIVDSSKAFAPPMGGFGLAATTGACARGLGQAAHGAAVQAHDDCVYSVAQVPAARSIDA